MSDLAPVVLFVYNRPDHTRRTLAALAANPLAIDSDLIIYADGPKKPEHIETVEQARKLARSASGFKSVKWVERDENWGLARSIITGVSEVCSEHGRAIVVEDDLLVAPNFLSFLNAGLDRYAEEPTVMQISAYSYPAHDRNAPQAFFLPMISCWGWATWASAWSRFDPSMALLARLDTDPVMRRRFNIDGAYDYYGMACQQRSKTIDSWGVRWQLSLFAHGGLVLYPRETLVSNIGVDASGTHGAGQAWLQRDLNLRDGVTRDWSWPTTIATDVGGMSQVKRLLDSGRPSFFRQVLNRIQEWR